MYRDLFSLDIAPMCRPDSLRLETEKSVFFDNPNLRCDDHKSHQHTRLTIDGTFVANSTKRLHGRSKFSPGTTLFISEWFEIRSLCPVCDYT